MTPAATKPPAIARTLPNAIVLTHEKNLGYGGNQKSCYRLAIAGRGRHHHHGASRFPVHPQAHPGHGLAHRQRPLSLRAGQPHPGRLRLARRHAPLEIPGQPPSDLFWKTCSWAPSSPNITPATAPFPAKSSSACPWRPIPTILSSTTRCWPRFSGSATPSPRSVVPTRYFAEASSINFRRSVKYGFGCLGTALSFRLAKMKLLSSKLFPPQ